MRTYENIDIDYDQFPVPDLSLDLHFIHLSAAQHREQQNARREAEEQARLATLPEEHKIILVPAHSTYSPRQAELWPIINYAVQDALRPYPAIFTQVMAAIDRAVTAHRGWQNPFPPEVPVPPPRVVEK